MEVVIDAGGVIAFLHDDDLYDLLSPAFPGLQTFRAGHVEPVPGGWQVDTGPLLRLTGGTPDAVPPVLPRRDLALALEADLVRRRLRGEP